MYFMRELTLFFSALADENRLRLLHLIRGGDVCVCELQAVFRTNQPKISRHLAYLKRAGLVEARREGKWVYYRLKKLEPAWERILTGILRGLDAERQIREDTKRFKRISDCAGSW